VKKSFSCLLLLLVLFPATLSFARQSTASGNFEAQKKMQRKQEKQLAKEKRKRQRKINRANRKAAQEYKRKHPEAAASH
jgi:hypothetical protein